MAGSERVTRRSGRKQESPPEFGGSGSDILATTEATVYDTINSMMSPNVVQWAGRAAIFPVHNWSG